MIDLFLAGSPLPTVFWIIMRKEDPQHILILEITQFGICYSTGLQLALRTLVRMDFFVHLYILF